MDPMRSSAMIQSMCTWFCVNLCPPCGFVLYTLWRNRVSEWVNERVSEWAGDFHRDNPKQLRPKHDKAEPGNTGSQWQPGDVHQHTNCCSHVSHPQQVAVRRLAISEVEKLFTATGSLIINQRHASTSFLFCLSLATLWFMFTLVFYLMIHFQIKKKKNVFDSSLFTSVYEFW